MKLSMWIFADWLKEYHPKADIHSNQFTIEAVRLFSANMTLNQNTLYIGRFSDFFKYGNDRVICIHNNDMLILETNDMEEILNSILNALDHYNSWNNHMLELLSSNAMLQDLLTASVPVLPLPFFLVDAGLRPLAYNTSYGIGQVDEIWDEILLKGSINMDILINLNEKHPERLRKRSIYYYSNETFPYPCYSRNFFYQNDWIGAVILIDMKETVSQGLLDLFSLFGNYLDRWFQLHIQEQHSMILNHLLLAAVTEQDSNVEELRRQLMLFGYKETDTLMLIKLDAPYQPFHINAYLCRTLNYNFKNLYAVPVDLSICLLCNITRHSLDSLKAHLIPWLERNKYYGISSPAFTLKDSFFLHYKYTELTSQYCKKIPGELYDGTQHVLPYIFYEIQQSILPDVLHPALHTLRAYDQKHHTQLYDTLYCYLKNERSLVRTAKELQLHRNSLAYRLNRIEELLDIDWEDFHTRLHLLISYEISTISTIS